ncbi:DUF4082 domain-containing protein [Amycolatopsis aidingensis]|uniref:DUF4082 domain-containing protein n=1 Tax=Amycolatopsis aidingensis TaxID=2842453 RepID=UPI001C0C0A78|nr:DUF4082 domain-containing protein [Amycolatopsis aidingensis]
MVFTSLLVFSPAAEAEDPCAAPVENPVACENTKPGTQNWMVEGLDDSIAGFTTDISTTQGGRVDFKIKTSAPSIRVDIFRLGYYGGTGARHVDSVLRNTPQIQPECLFIAETGMTDCGNWAVTASWDVPADAVSGIYYAVLHRNDTQGENEIAFVVRDDASTSDILMQTSDSTWHAYNRYGGNSLYYGTGPGPQGSGYAVSYNRPLFEPGEENFIFNAEYPMVRFLEANGYDVSYTTDVDTARRGHLIQNHKVFMPVGHDEYWSNEQRDNVEAAKAAGVHMAFLTGNEVFWKTRWEPSADSSGTPWRTVVCYKETKHNAKIDPSPEWTGTWRDPRFSPPSDGGRPENALLGNIFTVNGRRDDSLTVPAAFGKMRLWRHTSLQGLPAGGSYSFAPGTLGYEWNSVEDNGAQPAGVAQLSRTTVEMDGQYILQNYGDVYGPGTKTHALTLYRDQISGALVFGAGTVQWAWGLDDEHAFQTGSPTSDVRIQQATVNLLADMGVQPATLRAGLTQANPSLDALAPAVDITNAPPTTVGENYTFSGTVADTLGEVAGVEVSVDDGASWHPADWTAGSGAWSYTYTPAVSGTPQVQVRAVDDSANLSAPASATITVNPRTCPCSIWTDTATPDLPDAGDGSAVELGVKFRSHTAGYVRGVRFYKSTANTGTHTGSLWTADGQLLGTGTFSGETASGWQTLTLPTSVPVAADTTYVVSYFAPNGHYAADNFYFTGKEEFLDPLTALQSGVEGLNGVYRAGSSGFPTQSYQDTNYWVDVVWGPDPGPDTRAPEVLEHAPVTGDSSVAPDAAPSVGYDEAVVPESVDFTLTHAGGTVPGTVSVTEGEVTFTPGTELSPATSYTATVTAEDAAGNPAATETWSFTTGSPRPASCPCTIWDDFTHPVNKADPHDSSPVELGTKVRFDGKGEVLGVRFYKGTGNTGTHTGSFWSASGQLLATGTFTGETAAGWQALTFTEPVEVQANTTYVVSYYAPNGHYAGDNGYFADSGAAYGGINALADGVEAGNGVYRYGAGGGFPTASWGASNYWVDVIYRNGLNGDTTPPQITGRTPGPGAADVELNTAVTVSFTEPVDPASAQFALTDPGGAELGGELTLSADEHTVTFTPSARLAAGTSYGVSIKIADVNGVPMPEPETWSFTATGTQACPCSLFSAATLPTTPSADDPGSYELGVRFSSSVAGTVTGVKFYKGTGNTGTHTGSLWTDSGQLLATGTFTGETATGWQTLTFDTPVPIQAGQDYIASYTAPNGHYAADAFYFEQTGVTSNPLSAPATGSGTANGVYNAGPGFPTSTFRGGNYWVDVVFQEGI